MVCMYVVALLSKNPLFIEVIFTIVSKFVKCTLTLLPFMVILKLLSKVLRC